MYSPKPKRNTVYGLSKREEQSDDIRQARKSEVQIWKPSFLVQRVLRRHGGAEQKSNIGIYQEPVAGRYYVRSNFINHNHHLKWWYALSLEGSFTGVAPQGALKGSPTALLLRAAAKAAFFMPLNSCDP